MSRMAQIPAVTSKFLKFSPMYEIMLHSQYIWGQVFHFTILHKKIILIPGVHKSFHHIPNFRNSKKWWNSDFLHVTDTDFIFGWKHLWRDVTNPLYPLSTQAHGFWDQGVSKFKFSHFPKLSKSRAIAFARVFPNFWISPKTHMHVICSILEIVRI